MHLREVGGCEEVKLNFILKLAPKRRKITRREFFTHLQIGALLISSYRCSKFSNNNQQFGYNSIKPMCSGSVRMVGGVVNWIRRRTGCKIILLNAFTKFIILQSTTTYTKRTLIICSLLVIEIRWLTVTDLNYFLFNSW